MIQVQYDFFKDPQECEEEALKNRILKTESTLDKVRKGTYAALSRHSKELEELKQDLEIIKKGLCTGVFK